MKTECGVSVKIRGSGFMGWMGFAGSKKGQDSFNPLHFSPISKN
jgi:hypothetical protein